MSPRLSAHILRVRRKWGIAFPASSGAMQQNRAAPSTICPIYKSLRQLEERHPLSHPLRSRFRSASALVICLISCCSVWNARASPTYVKLSEAACQSKANTHYSGSWPATWQPFEAQAKACPLQVHPGQKPEIWLLSIWAEEYLAAHPEIENWPSFPRPQIVDKDGRCLGTLPELFPVDEPRTLTLTYERSRSRHPRQIIVRVDNPAEGGSYNLPIMRWNARHKQYQAVRATTEHSVEETACPN